MTPKIEEVREAIGELRKVTEGQFAHESSYMRALDYLIDLAEAYANKELVEPMRKDERLYLAVEALKEIQRCVSYNGVPNDMSTEAVIYRFTKQALDKIKADDVEKRYTDFNRR